MPYIVFTRQCRAQHKKALRLAKENAMSDQSPPSLPDGHPTIVDVTRLSCVLNQVSDGLLSSAFSIGVFLNVAVIVLLWHFQRLPEAVTQRSF